MLTLNFELNKETCKLLILEIMEEGPYRWAPCFSPLQMQQVPMKRMERVVTLI